MLKRQKSGDVPQALAFDRRSFMELLVKGVATGALGAALPGCGGGGGTGEVESRAAVPSDGPALAERQTLSRTSFGLSASELDNIRRVGVQRYIEQQLDYRSIDTGWLEAEVARLFPLSLPPAKSPGFFDIIDATPIIEDLQSASLCRAYLSPRQLYEVMVEFWSNHFSLVLPKANIAALKPADDASVARAHALGRFRDILNASVRSPAMLISLDNYLNGAGNAQENYARELMELHTLGVNGGYTQKDVTELAKVLTGWSIDFSNSQFRFYDNFHDNGPKTFLGFDLPAGGGSRDVEIAVDILASHRSTAEFIAAKMCRRFVADDPPLMLVKEVADSFMANDGDIAAMLRTLFSSDTFFASSGLKFRRPIEFVGQLVRALSDPLSLPDAAAVQRWRAWLDRLGQLPFNWAPPDGYPDDAEYWASSSGLLYRWQIGLQLALSDTSEFPLEQLGGSANTFATLVDTIAANLQLPRLSEAEQQSIISWLTGQSARAANEPLPPTIVAGATPLVAALLISSARFQLR